MTASVGGTTPTVMRRYHSLDSLRGILMLLGLVIHSAINYMVIGTDVWPFKDASTSIVFDFILFFIHIFRMPAFFLIAGFFAAFLYYKRGSGTMTKNRTVRVLVPFVLGWVVLYPLIMSGFAFSAGGGGEAGWSAAVAYFQSGAIYPEINLAHLWFLWDLILFYVAFLVIMQVVNRLPERIRESVNEAFGRFAVSIWGLVAMIIITTVTLFPMSFAGLDTDTSLAPPVRILMAYLVFFTYGWLLFNRKERVDSFARRGVLNLIAGSVFGIAYYVFAFQILPFSDPIIQHIFGSSLCSASMWLLTYGFLGVFVKYFDKPSPIGRYISDSSYWLYLLHLPITIWLPGTLVGFAWPAYIKFAIVLGATTTVTLFTYHFLVRSTAIGWLLNGRKYPRALPKYDESGEYIGPQTTEFATAPARR